MPPAIFYRLVINRFLKPNRISPYLSRRIYPVRLHVRTNTYTGPPMVDVITVKTKNIFPFPALRHNSTVVWTQLEDSNNYEYSSGKGTKDFLIGMLTRLTSFRREDMCNIFIHTYRSFSNCCVSCCVFRKIVEKFHFFFIIVIIHDTIIRSNKINNINVWFIDDLTTIF